MKKGQFGVPEETVKYVLIAISIIVLILLLSPLYGSGVSTASGGWACTFSLHLNNYIKTIKPLCISPRISLTENALKGDGSKKDQSIKFVFDEMRRCKSLTSGANSVPLFSGKECYLCSVIDTGPDIPEVSLEEVLNYATDEKVYLKRSKEPISYLRDLQSPGNSEYPHVVKFDSPIKPNTHYAIVYVDNERVGLGTLLVGSVAPCVAAGAAVFGTAVLPPLSGLILGATPYVCGAGLVAVGVAFSIDQIYGKNINKIYFVDLKKLRPREGFECAGYAY
jgi:hypothetical protein